MWYNKKKNTFSEDFLDDIEEIIFEIDEVPWLNAPTINSTISVE